MKLLILQVFYSLFSGIIESIAIPNEFLLSGSPILALFSLVPLYIALYRARSYTQAFGLMFLQTITVHLASSFWLANFRDFAVFTLGASAVGTAVEGGITGIIFYAPLSVSTHKKTPAARILWFTACWIAYEWFKSVGFLGYPWGTLFLAAYKWKIFTQIASLTGVWGVTFIYALFGALTGEGLLLLGKGRISAKDSYSYLLSARFTALIFVFAALYGLYEYCIPRKAYKTIQTIAVQQNLDPWDGGEDKSLEVSMKLTQEAVNQMRSNNQEPELVLWSEGVLSRSFPNSRFYYANYPQNESLSDFIRRMDVPFIIGGQTRVNTQKRHYSNSAIFFDRTGEYAGFYSKTHLVPFAEDIPFDDNPLVQFALEKLIGFSSGWTPGYQYMLFRVPAGDKRFFAPPLEYTPAPVTTIPLDITGLADSDITERFIEENSDNPDNFVTFSVPICFEDAFSDVLTPLFNLGTEVFMNITNDSWSKTKSAEYQHFAIACYSAISYRTTLVRCANSGITAVVDPAGKVLQSLPPFSESAMSFKVPVYPHRATVYSRFGDWLPYSIFVLMGLYLAYLAIYIRTGGICMRRLTCRLNYVP